MRSLLHNYSVLQETFETVSMGSDDYARRASGLLALMQRFSTFFGLTLSLAIFAVTDDLSCSLQRIKTTSEDAPKAAELCVTHLHNMRSEDAFTNFFEGAKKEAEANECDEPRLPRARRPPHRIDDGGAEAHRHPDVSAYFRQQYFEAIDTVKSALKDRFSHKNFDTVRQIEQLLANGGKGLEETNIPTTYSKDLNIEKLKLQLTVLPDALKDKKPTIQSVVEVLSAGTSIQSMLSEVTKLVKLYLTVPVTTSSAERSFSALRRVKTFLRNSMTQERLNHCFIMHVMKEKAEQLGQNLDVVLEDFACRNPRRVNFFG